MTIKITLTPGHGMNYHSHENRDEVWTVISGTGHAILDGVRRDVKAGDILTMPAGLPPHSLCRQRAENHRGSARSGHQRGG